MVDLSSSSQEPVLLKSDASSMAKKRSWFNLLKRLLFADTHSKPKKEKKRRKWVFTRLTIKRLAPIAAPSPSPSWERTELSEAEEEQSKHALSVALAIAAAAEAAEVALLAGTSKSVHQWEKEADGLIQNDASQCTHQFEMHIPQLAAVKIQTAFRGYLARKALRALKGIVKLQAIIRGRAVRRQAISTLKCLQSIVNIQSQVCARRGQMAEDTWYYDENKQLPVLRDKIIKVDTNSQRRWDDNILTKEEAEAFYLSKKEEAIKKERIKEYSFNHRNSAETERNKVNGRLRCWLENRVDNQVVKSKELEDLDSVLTSNPKTIVEYRGKQLKLRSYQRQYSIEGLDSPMSTPRRSFHRKQCSLEGNSFSSSPIFPTYMAATESARAKARSVSSPKLRPGAFDAYSDSYSPCKNNISLTSFITSEMPSIGRLSKPRIYQQRSPSLKGVPGPIKSSRTLKDLSFDSEYSMPNWDRQSNFR